MAAARGLLSRFRLLDECGLPDTLVHGDFHSGNWRSDGGPPVGGRPSGGGLEPEPVHVHPVGLELQPVGLPAPVQAAARHRGERLPYAGDQRLQAAARRTGRLIVPHRVDQLGNRHRPPGPQRQHAEHESLLRGLRWRPGADRPDLDGTQHPQHDVVFHPGSLGPAHAARP